MESLTGKSSATGKPADFYNRKPLECETDGDAGRRAEGQVGEVRRKFSSDIRQN